jgi:hypothetical protein
VLGELGRDLGVSALPRVVGGRLERGSDVLVRLHGPAGEMHCVLLPVGDKRGQQLVHVSSLGIRRVAVHQRPQQRVREPNPLAVHNEHANLNSLLDAVAVDRGFPQQRERGLCDGGDREESRPGTGESAARRSRIASASVSGIGNASPGALLPRASSASASCTAKNGFPAEIRYSTRQVGCGRLTDS